MKTFRYTITDPEGIHARPAGLFVKQAGKYESSVTISKNGKEVDAKRIMGVMSLGVKKGEEVTLNVEGTDEDQAVVELEKFFKENL